MSEPELKKGQSFTYLDQYETVEARVIYARTIEGFSAFKIHVNGRPVVITRAFILMLDKLNDLIGKYQLIESKSK
ncbi:hypothetical protein [Maribacter sp. ACAM166]|uniref:hypothetical protein n=1 Tax=Maribacter sp. ACAM166 TaxID=2508996 RepID=UPI0010FF5A2F|nr:hypothetical protein [Maribacter sp. ACAM166]TLP74247.1 hypothetical protein ES765_16235 [Maribacter sp. ACAM166]